MIDVVDHQVEAADRAGQRLVDQGRCPCRSSRPIPAASLLDTRRRRPMPVHVGDEPELLDVERLGPVDVGTGMAWLELLMSGMLYRVQPFG